MEIDTVLRWAASIIAGLGGLYGLHKVALWMESRGLIYYVHKKPESSPMGSFIALQKVLEPRAEYVLRAPRAYHRTKQDAGQRVDLDSQDVEDEEGRDQGPP
jgi:hypothetical protein